MAKIKVTWEWEIDVDSLKNHLAGFGYRESYLTKECLLHDWGFWFEDYADLGQYVRQTAKVEWIEE